MKSKSRYLLSLLPNSCTASLARIQGSRDRRRTFIDELKKNVPVHPATDATAEIAGTIGGEQAAKGITIPIDDLLIGTSAIEQGYAVATRNLRHFKKDPLA